MASQVTQDGHVIPPLNIAAPAPIVNLRGFRWTTVDDILNERPIPPGEHAVEEKPAAEQKVVAGQAPQPPTQRGDSGPLPAPRLPLSPEGLGSQLPLQLAPQEHDALPDFPLSQFSGAYAGNGFNLIFRPRPKNDATFFKNKVDTGGFPDDNTLELNLTTEQLTFGRTIGDIPNRGLSNNNQPDINLGGIPYLQTIQDVTNPASGKGDRADPKGIHFEPGMWLTVPETTADPKNGPTVVRMASIPHGTTINAQCLSPHKEATTLGGKAQGPKFEKLNTMPFVIDSDGLPKDRIPFPSMKAETLNSPRIPQDLSPYIKAGTINTDIIANPNLVLERAIKGQDIRETITFEVTTGVPTDTLNGGGTANISFLVGTQTPAEATIAQAAVNSDKKLTTERSPVKTPNANAVLMRSRFWIETVAYDVVVPRFTSKGFVTLKPNMPSGSTAPTPEFLVFSPDRLPSESKTIKIPGVQIQYTQVVNLNFGGLTWPHVSVATLCPKNPQPFQMT